MWQALVDLLDTLFRRETSPPEGAIKMYEAMESLEESTRELRDKLQQHPEYIIQTDPIRNHMVPNYTRRG